MASANQWNGMLSNIQKLKKPKWQLQALLRNHEQWPTQQETLSYVITKR